MTPDPQGLLIDMYHAGVAAASPAACLAPHWPEHPAGRVGVIACGKAAVQMSAQAFAHYGPAASGIVIHPDNELEPDQVPASFIRFAASHPVPGEVSMSAAKAALEFAAGMDGRDLMLVLLSGGGSSLMSLPAPGVTPESKRDLGRQLLASGASISEINCVRKHVSSVKGGRLASVCPARLVTLAISDVPGDDPSTIASGPTVEDATTLAEARAILLRYGIQAGPGIEDALLDPANESPRFDGNGPLREFRVIAGGDTALKAAAGLCAEAGYATILLGDRLEGPACELARTHARLALEQLSRGYRCCILSGGETTVTPGDNPGTGGRNTEYALALAIELDGREGIWAIAADTDGIDGYGGHAGALIDSGTLAHARAAGLDAASMLHRHDSATFFRHTGGLLVEGPTGTNVNDFRAILVNPP